MHREPLLRLLRHYADAHPDEAQTVADFIRFVEEEPDCFQRSLQKGHVTGSAWIANALGDQVLLTHHRKLNLWLQLGGHADGNPDVQDVAHQEALEESGLHPLAPLSTAIFDLDIHRIPERPGEPAHLHYDVRFAFQYCGTDPFVISSESHALAWVPLTELERYTSEPCIERMKRKWEIQYPIKP